MKVGIALPGFALRDVLQFRAVSCVDLSPHDYARIATECSRRCSDR